VALPQDTVVQPANSLGQYVVVTGPNFAEEIDEIDDQT